MLRGYVYLSNIIAIGFLFIILPDMARGSFFWTNTFPYWVFMLSVPIGNLFYRAKDDYLSDNSYLGLYFKLRREKLKKEIEKLK